MTKTIRNYIAALAALSFLMVPTIANADFLGYAMGVTVQGGAAEVKAFETDPEGTKKDGLAKEEVIFPSLFAEIRYGLNDRLSVAVGVDLLPGSAEFVQETKADTDLIDKDSSANTGTSKVTGAISGFAKVYIQPTVRLTDVFSVYLTAGMSTMDVDVDADLVTSTNFNKTATSDGTHFGAGIMAENANGFFMKVEGNASAYDSVSYTTSDSTVAKVSNLDEENVTLLIGKGF